MNKLLNLFRKKDICPLKDEKSLRDIMDNTARKARYKRYKQYGWIV